jgi:hypothetical protein
VWSVLQEHLLQGFVQQLQQLLDKPLQLPSSQLLLQRVLSLQQPWCLVSQPSKLQQPQASQQLGSSLLKCSSKSSSSS